LFIRTPIVALSGLILAASSVHAHISYKGTFSYTGLSTQSNSVTNQAVSGNYGWADAADADFGDSHKARAFRFHLDNESLVTITAQANAGATSTSIGGLMPGFSVYNGLVHTTGGADYDTANITKAYLNATYPNGSGGTTKEGAWNALGDWKVGNDAGVNFSDLSTLTFKGYAVDGTSANFVSLPGVTGDGNQDGVVTKTFRLAAGDYSLFVGGAHYAAQNPSNPDLSKSYGLSTTISVSAVPEPESLALVLAGLVIVGFSRRQAIRG
jgi:PEP-CTERM motif